MVSRVLDSVLLLVEGVLLLERLLLIEGRCIHHLLLMATQESIGVVHVLVEVSLVRHEHRNVDRVLINDHACDLASQLLAQHAVDRWVDGVTHHLVSLRSVGTLLERLRVEGGKWHVDHRLGWWVHGGSGLLLLLGHSRHEHDGLRHLVLGLLTLLLVGLLVLTLLVLLVATTAI